MNAAQATQEVLKAMGCCPRCGGQTAHLFRSAATLHTGEVLVHCGCIWSAAEKWKALLATQETVNVMHITRIPGCVE